MKVVSVSLANGPILVNLAPPNGPSGIQHYYTPNYLYLGNIPSVMGLRDAVPEGPLRKRLKSDKPSEITISDLREEFGTEAVNRGIAYMASLADADKNYRESIDPEKMKRETLKSLGAPDAEPAEGLKKASDKWERKSKEKGIGISEE